LKDPTFAIAQNLVEVEYKDLPGQIVDIAKKEVLDSLGVALAGSAAPGIQELAEVLKGFGGNKQASMIAGRLKLPVLFAAQVNASMMHALDYDDAMDNTVAHTGCITVPVCFALSECRGKISGKDCITALTLGADLMARLGLATKYKGGMVKAGWFYASLYGYMTAAAVSGKILGFNENKMINALGLAYQMTSGNQQAVIDGALAKRMAVGFAASGGIMAALMAEKGITGAKNIIEGDYGLFNVYHRGAYDREALLSDLGQDFKLKDLTIKPYPSCRLTHPFIDAALALVKEHDIKADQVTGVTIFGGEAGYSLSVPLEVKCSPRTIVDSQFSVPWGVATAIVKRRFAIADISEKAIVDPGVLAMAKKIQAKKDTNLTAHAMEPGRVEIVTSHGSYVRKVDYPTGGPQNPMSFDACAAKFRDCASYSRKRLSKSVIEEIITRVSMLDELDDISGIIRMVS
jgi:2-methylcitrate dehydratase PrpD